MPNAVKALCVVVLVAAGFWLYGIPVDSEKDPYLAVGYGAAGLACMVAAMGFFFVPVSQWALGLVDALFMPAGTYTAPALYKLPEWYISQGRYADALGEYEKILKNHPRDLAAYEGQLYVHYACMGNTAAAEKLFPKALRRTAKEKRPELEAYMEALRAGQAQPPSRSLE
jgi:tetratricopeptide (TPR) repeat protein